MKKTNIIILLAIVAGLGLTYYFVFAHGWEQMLGQFKGNANTNQNSPACTLEAKLCPDGSYVGRSGPNCEFAACPKEDPVSKNQGILGTARTFALNEHVSFNDGLTVTLLEINDSRCQKDVVCIWAGELSLRFRLTGGAVGTATKEIRLGSTTMKSATESGYQFTYEAATATTATILVTKGETAQLEGGITGTVLLGPTCPVERIPPDPNCADKPYAAALEVTTADQSRVIKEFSSNEQGKFTVQLPAGEYTIRRAAAINTYPYCSSQGTFTVKPGIVTTVAVSCDTGIR